MKVRLLTIPPHETTLVTSRIDKVKGGDAVQLFKVTVCQVSHWPCFTDVVTTYWLNVQRHGNEYAERHGTL